MIINASEIAYQAFVFWVPLAGLWAIATYFIVNAAHTRWGRKRA